ncbi:hypothetical protein JXB41_06360 [Candidatus Woesearchaeota archaeon]|nr:hypothetical protein [Candidatus Woesearchaeota archaeon]
MSQFDNKVKWCLNKAKKEIEQGKKHRGLLKINPDIEEAKKHLKKAEHNYKAVLFFEKTGFSDWSVSAGFYTIYHCFLGIIKKIGYESQNQECTIALIEQLKNQNKIDLSKDIVESLKTIEPEEQHKDNVITIRENFQY